MSSARRLPPAAAVLPAQVYYGWYVALACTVMMFVTVGVGYYGLSVFLRPLQEAHGWSTGVVSGATGMYFAVSGLSSLLVGPYIDRHGPPRFMAVGVILTALGAASVGFVHSIWQLYLAYAVMAVAFGLGAAVPVMGLMSRWFINHRAKAISLSSTGVSVGGAVLVPVGAWLVGAGGLSLAAPVLGALVLVVALPVLALVVAQSPESMGLRPDGHDGPEAAAARGASRVELSSQYRSWTRAAAMRTVSFWAIIGAFALTLATQTAVLIHQLAFLQGADKLGSRSAAALAVTTTAVGSIVARLILGQLFADKADKRLMAVGLFLLQGLSILGYVALSGTVGLYVAAMLFGFTIGNVYMMQSLLVAEIFGIASFGTIYGIVALAGQLGSAAGLVYIGWARDLAGGYAIPFLMLAVLNGVSAGLVVFARPLPAPATALTDVAVEAGVPAPG